MIGRLILKKKLDETSPPINRDASLCPPRMKLDAKLDAFTAAIPLNDRLASRQSTKFAGATSARLSVALPFRKHYNAVRLGIRKRLEKHCVAHTENGGIRPNTERQSYHCRRCESRVLRSMRAA